MSSNEKYIVLIGETGSGKSTFINYLANYFKRGTVDNPNIAIPTRFHRANMDFSYREQSVNDVTTSKTADCHCYTFKLSGIKFQFVDTPGISDTGGLLQDSRNIDKIFGYIEQLPEITALILIINGAVSRATVNIRHVLSTFHQRVPDVVYNNMFIVLTNCQPHTVSFHPSDFGLPSECPVFHMQNSAFSSDFHLWSEMTRNKMEQDFQKSMDIISDFIVKLLQLEPQLTTKFKDMNDDRNLIQRELHDVRMMLIDLQHLEDELVGYELSAGIHNNNVEKFRNFIQSKQVTRLERVSTNFYSTTCSTCNSVCHENCRLNEVPYTGDKTFLRCAVMKHGICQKCECHARSHYHDRSVIRLITRTIQERVSSLEERYREARAGKQRADVECSNIQQTKRVIESELTLQYNKVKQSIERLRQTCSGVNVTMELYDFIVCLKKDAAVLKTPSVIEKANAFIVDLEQLCKIMENTSTPIRVNGDHQNVSSPSISKCKSTVTPRRKTLISGTLTTPDTIRSTVTVSKSIETPTSKSTEDAIEMNNLSPPVMTEREQSLSLQISENENDVNAFFDASDNFTAGKNTNKPTIVSQSISNSNPNTQLRETVPNSDSTTQELRVNFAALTLSELIKASKQIKNKEIRKELENRCRGKSLGLLSNTQHLQLCKYFVHFQSDGFKQWTYKRAQLEDCIQEAISYDPFNIENVDKTNLLQLAAINLLILSEPIEDVV